jgi:osmotically inducible protein OsmC
MPTRTARTTWTGGFENGTVRVALLSSGIGAYEVSFPKRMADSAEGTTSPEELIAAAHTACYAMQVAALLDGVGADERSFDVRADVTLGPDPEGGFRISDITLTLRGSARGVSAAEFAEIAQEAKNSCPVSKALTGTEIFLEVIPSLRLLAGSSCCTRSSACAPTGKPPMPWMPQITSWPVCAGDRRVRRRG